MPQDREAVNVSENPPNGDIVKWIEIINSAMGPSGAAALSSMIVKAQAAAQSESAIAAQSQQSRSALPTVQYTDRHRKAWADAKRWASVVIGPLLVNFLDSCDIIGSQVQVATTAQSANRGPDPRGMTSEVAAQWQELRYQILLPPELFSFIEECFGNPRALIFTNSARSVIQQTPVQAEEPQGYRMLDIVCEEEIGG